jgi:hypothetical protein
MIVVKEMPKGWVAFMENDKSAEAHPRADWGSAEGRLMPQGSDQGGSITKEGTVEEWTSACKEMTDS